MSTAIIVTLERGWAVRRKKLDPSIEAMADAGCCEGTIKDYIRLGKENDREGQYKVLEKHRRTLLAQVHACQKKIDVLDYLVYRMEKDN